MEIVKCSSKIEDKLAVFFQEMDGNSYFVPHEFTDKMAKEICNYSGKDLYICIVYDGAVVGYGMLRGWDEGYEVPSLGICLSSSVRGKGLGKMFMHYLHSLAKMSGAQKVRLKVFKNNKKAHSMYKSLGYEFEEFNEKELVGHINV